MQELQAERVFTDKMSGKDAHNRPQLQAMLDFVRESDVVVSESISRIARSTRDFLAIMDKLKEKNVTYISKKESIDTSTPQGVFMLTVFAALSELERQTTRQRALEGIAEAKKRGVYKGRKPIEIDATYQAEVLRRLLDGYDYVVPYSYKSINHTPKEHILSPVRTYGMLRYEIPYLEHTEAKTKLKQKLKELDAWVDEAEEWLAICNLGGLL
jgi:DNA invertase Pin-like site-specific DNA recombinase